MAQKLLLFWRKPARRCWWEGVELHDVEGVPGKLKVWIRRVWTLEMVSLSFFFACDPSSNIFAERDRPEIKHVAGLALDSGQTRSLHLSQYPSSSVTRSTCWAFKRIWTLLYSSIYHDGALLAGKGISNLFISYSACGGSPIYRKQIVSGHLCICRVLLCSCWYLVAAAICIGPISSVSSFNLGCFTKKYGDPRKLRMAAVTQP